MATIIRIKRSGTTGSPTTLKLGELAYTYLGGTQSNGGDRLYVGTGGVDSIGDALTLDVIGGKYFTDRLDHVEGVLTANSAILVDSASKIDRLNVDNLRLDANAITSTNTNGNISLTPNGLGEVIASTLTVSDLTDNRVTIAGTSGALEDDANFTFDGTTFVVGSSSSVFGVTVANGNTTIGGQATIASAAVTDLTDNRIVIVGTSGELEDDANFTFDGSNLIVSTNAAIQIPAGTDLQRPTAVQGQIRYNTTANQFEGYDGTNWSGLGGVIDADQDTKITAEKSSGDDSDALKFFTAGVLRMTLDSSALSLDGVNLIRSTSGNRLTIDPNPVGDSGELVILGNLKVEGTTTTINSTTLSINDKNIVLADSAADSAEANDAGFTINGPSIPATFVYKAAPDTFQINRPFTTPGGGITNVIENYTTDNLTEGSSNLYYTDERVDDRLSNLLLAGEAIDLTYDDNANTLQIDVELATVTNPGAAYFDSDQMTVTSGFVTIYELDGGVY
mgnify:CR=1 FL=1